jgi:CRP-like cAMP-binding protein
LLQTKPFNKNDIFNSFLNLKGKDVKRFSENEYLFHQKEKVKGIYLIKSGIVKIVKSGFGNIQTILSLYKTGDIVGASFVSSQEYYSYSAIAIGKVEAEFISSNNVQEYLLSNSNVRLQLLLFLCNEAEIKETKVAQIAQSNLRKIVAHTLITLYNEYGSSRTKEIKINLTLEDIASYSGMSVSYLRKVFLYLEQEDLIKLMHKKSVHNHPIQIKILNLSELKMIATK